MKKKGQLKIQQMAFVLVALMIFIAMVGIIFFSVYLSDLRKDVQDLRDKEAREIVRKIASSPEFIFSPESCASCVDFVKVLKLKDLDEYKKFYNLNLDYLVLEKINNETTKKECVTNVNDCDKITIIGDSGLGPGSIKGSFVTLVRWDENLGGGNYRNYRYELGKIYVSEVDVKK